MFLEKQWERNFLLLDELKPKFLTGCNERGHDVEIAEKFGEIGNLCRLAFNKSHSTYALIAFHTVFSTLSAEYMCIFNS